MAELGCKQPTDEGFSETSFRLLVESVIDYAIFMLDPQGYILTWNQGAQRMKGYSAGDIIGKHFSTFYTEPDRLRDHPAEELRIARKEGRYEEEGWRVRKDGTRFWANVVITAVHDHTGRFIGFGKVTRDLTEKKLQEEQERELRREQTARAAAEAASLAKTQFLTTMSHELRTPLNAILGYIDLLSLGVQGPITAEQLVSLDRVRNSSRHLLSLINDVLNVARTGSGRIEYNIRPVPATEIMSAVAPLVEPQFTAHEIAFVVHDCDAAMRVTCDPDRTQQILLNLLTNAYKFTPLGGQVDLLCMAEPDQVHFLVKDTGRGIAQETLPTIFEPFVQIDRYLNRESQQGVGLGLSISRDLARAMQGELIVESAVGRGSTFTLSLPAARA